MSNINVLVDGLIFERQSHGGVNSMYQELLPRLCAVDPTIRVSIFSNRKLAQPLPVGRCIDRLTVFSPERFLRPGRLLGWSHTAARAVCVQPQIRQRRGSIWHSTYYTRPHHWGGPVVVTVFDLIHERFPGMFSHQNSALRRKSKCIEGSDAVVAISETTKTDLVSHYGVHPEKVSVVHLAAGPAFRVEEEIDVPIHPRPFLLYVGSRRAPYKNVRLLLEAYSRWDKNVDIDLLLVGPAPTEEESDLASLRAGSGGGKLHFLSDVSDGDLARIYRQALGLVYPSLYEGFGIPLLEAMASGCPVVASSIPSSVEVAGDAALYFRPQDQDSLLGALDQLLDPGISATMVQKGEHRAGDFSWERAARDLVSVYEGVS